MGWFSPIKGHYPSLGQIDATLPVSTDSTSAGILRGMIVANNAGTFEIPASVTTANEGLLYIALQDYKDAQAGMAGTTGFEDASSALTGVTPGVPSITGLSLSMDGEYETDQYLQTGSGAISSTDSIGTKLTVKNGLLAKAGDSDIVVGYLTAKVGTRWINNATAKSNGTQVTRQGKTASVIRYRTK